MELQAAFNLMVLLASALGGWLLKSIYDAIKDLRDENGRLHTRVNDLSSHTSNTYVRKDDFRDAIIDLKATLLRIEQKLDNKVDKVDCERLLHP